jgi:quercetin dioxygenase-like cupin family protein
MIGAGQRYRSPTMEIEFLVTTRESGGDLHEMRATYQPDSPFPPAHLHPHQEETFRVESGRLEFELEDDTRTIAPGETLVLPAGTAHRARNPSSDTEAVVLWQTRPALRSGEFFATAYRLSRPDLLDQALLARTFRNEFRPVMRPAVLTTVAVPALALIARLTGRRLPQV